MSSNSTEIPSLPLRIVLVGEESAGATVLRSIVTTGHDVVAVLTGGAPASTPAVAAVASQLRLQVTPARFVREEACAEMLERERVDLLLNVHSLFKIPASVLLAPRIGSFNLHPGPLPRYAGLNAPSWAISHGEKRYGTTVHWMVSEIDAGPIAFQELFEIAPDDTGLSLTLKCVRSGVPLVSKVVAAAASSPGSIPRIEQNLNERSYFPPGPPNEGEISWTMSAREIVDLVRASDYAPFPSPWGSPWTTLRGRRIEITKATLTAESASGAAPGSVRGAPTGDVLAASGDEWIRLERVRVDGAPATAVDLLRSGQAFDG